ncbi:enoyl-CoA hydratase/isomerase family protein [Corynebacterium sp. 153RC1]|uniref:enoyl-CoA hydratase/isomerase family protein n=1 Tax=unclassified Corynebacterium TaxID=2624378 RepID=UPI00211CE226|nr:MULTISPECIES: enoyl-CoA hydratase/isomerase family protein [unclassified Corynebacterium]MCQ9370685.1 enoyl-CoA hydratase/isomerase family protein [Corynebacterium sp. 35RC1]MCQ9352616.1 enoyl-CoA hydratase/isomerase family protein [Corynebacterium sp. 209RC1]MCQ9354800.1 enoyl-CoA hydratase/isomerase family protein [Corynebacterium sp. 1222RC1]MCQ9356985.1 enoyl-CoA hydratase/isomerase family protein [Corynebacterium sp. 122RC1]MCQ9359068.1 enoyl-CoA hydratase/isomerase family protein [Cor
MRAREAEVAEVLVETRGTAGIITLNRPKALNALVESAAEVDAILAEYAADPGEAFSGQVDRIEAAYQGQTVAEILAALDAEEADFAADAAKRIRWNSPTACVLTLAYICRATNFTLREALEHEFAVSNNMHAHPDFVEGVRAQIIDKDRNPK